MLTITMLGYTKGEKARLFKTNAGKPVLNLQVYVKIKDEYHNWDALIFNEKVISYIQGKIEKDNLVYIEGLPLAEAKEYKGKLYVNKTIMVSSISLFPQDSSLLKEVKPLEEVSQASFDEDDIPF